MITLIKELDRRTKNVSNTWAIAFGLGSAPITVAFYDLTSLGFVQSFLIAFSAALAVTFTHAWINGKTKLVKK